MKLLHLPHDVSGMLKKVFEKITRDYFGQYMIPILKINKHLISALIIQ